MEEVKTFKYLRYIFHKNRGKEEQVKDRVKKETALLGQV